MTLAIFLISFIEGSEKCFGKMCCQHCHLYYMDKEMSKRLTGFPKAAEQVTSGTRNGPCILMFSSRRIT